MGLRVYGGVSADRGVGVWVALEVNLLRFLGLLIAGQEAKADSPIKYFLVQRAGSALVVLGVLVSF